jgi:hypothetical protein
MALDMHDHVEHGLAFLARDLVRGERTLLLAAPDPYFERHRLAGMNCHSMRQLPFPNRADRVGRK